MNIFLRQSLELSNLSYQYLKTKLKFSLHITAQYRSGVGPRSQPNIRICHSQLNGVLGRQRWHRTPWLWLSVHQPDVSTQRASLASPIRAVATGMHARATVCAGEGEVRTLTQCWLPAAAQTAPSTQQQVQLLTMTVHQRIQGPLHIMMTVRYMYCTVYSC